MVMTIEWAAAWVAAVNLTAIFATVWDKRNARRRAERVPERTLFLIAALGGAVAMWVTMRLVRHKTLHRRFMWGLPAIILLQGALVYALWTSEYLRFI